jgi:hypothetical protein
MATWDEIKRPFRDALIAAYNWDRLALVLAYLSPSRRLDRITSENEGFDKNVDDVIADAVQTGWLEDLARGALEENPEHSALKESVPQIVQGVEDEGKDYYQRSTTVLQPDDEPTAGGHIVSSGTISTGSFSGINVGVTIGHGSSTSVSGVTINAVPAADDAAQKELERLIARLNALLKEVAASQREDADAVAQSTQMLLDTASVETPNPTLVQSLGSMLQQSAQAFKDNLPEIVEVAGKIALAATAVAKAAR